jgi:hypothetical protein
LATDPSIPHGSSGGSEPRDAGGLLISPDLIIEARRELARSYLDILLDATDRDLAPARLLESLFLAAIVEGAVPEAPRPTPGVVGQAQLDSLELAFLRREQERLAAEVHDLRAINQGLARLVAEVSTARSNDPGPSSGQEPAGTTLRIPVVDDRGALGTGVVPETLVTCGKCGAGHPAADRCENCIDLEGRAAFGEVDNPQYRAERDPDVTPPVPDLVAGGPTPETEALEGMGATGISSSRWSPERRAAQRERMIELRAQGVCLPIGGRRSKNAGADQNHETNGTVQPRSPRSDLTASTLREFMKARNLNPHQLGKLAHVDANAIYRLLNHSVPMAQVQADRIVEALRGTDPVTTGNPAWLGGADAVAGASEPGFDGADLAADLAPEIPEDGAAIVAPVADESPDVVSIALETAEAERVAPEEPEASARALAEEIADQYLAEIMSPAMTEAVTREEACRNLAALTGWDLSEANRWYGRALARMRRAAEESERLEYVMNAVRDTPGPALAVRKPRYALGPDGQPLTKVPIGALRPGGAQGVGTGDVRADGRAS